MSIVARLGAIQVERMRVGGCPPAHSIAAARLPAKAGGGDHAKTFPTLSSRTARVRYCTACKNKTICNSIYMVIHPDSHGSSPNLLEAVARCAFSASKPRRMAQSRDAHTGSARSVNKHATVDVQGVAGDVAREVGRTARLEKSQLVRAWTCTICSGPVRRRRWAF